MQKRVWVSHNWFWFHLWLYEKVAQVLLVQVSVEPITFHSRENCSNFVVVSFSATSSEWLVICSYSDVPGVVHVHVLELDLVTVEKLFFHTLTAVC